MLPDTGASLKITQAAKLHLTLGMLTARAPGGSWDIPHNQIFPNPTKLKKIHIRKRACLDLLGEKIKQIVKSNESIVAYSPGCIQNPSISASAGYVSLDSSVRMDLLNKLCSNKLRASTEELSVPAPQ